MLMSYDDEWGSSSTWIYPRAFKKSLSLTEIIVKRQVMKYTSRYWLRRVFLSSFLPQPSRVCVFFLLCWVWVEVPPLCCYQYSHSPCDDLSPLSVHPFLIYYEYGGVSPWRALRRNYTPFNLTKTCRSICHTYQSSSSTRDRVCCLWGHRRVCKCVCACLYLLHT